MKSDTTDVFLAFLTNRLNLEEWEVPALGEWSNMGNTIGAIALRSGVLSLEQIEQILDAQESENVHRLFGQVAIGLGCLTPQQVDRLLQIQELNTQLSLVRQLVLQGRLELPAALESLSEFTACCSNSENCSKAPSHEALATSE